MTDRPAAVVPTGYDPGSYTCVRSLAGLGVSPIIASEHDDVPAAASRFCDSSVVVPSPHTDIVGYKDALVNLARRESVETILPIRPHDPYIFAKYYEEFDEHVSLVTPRMEQLEQVFDRVALVEAAKAAGVPVPETRRLSAVEELDTDAIVKSRYNLLTQEFGGANGSSETVKGIEYVPAETAADIDAIIERMHHEPIAQEYIGDGDEYLFGALYDNGDPLATFQHRQVRGDSYAGGGGVYRVSTDNPRLEATARQLLDHLDWHGLACIEYVEDPDSGAFKLVEINPRLWQSLPLAVRAGADFPAHYWHTAIGHAERITDEYRIGVGSHLLYGELGYLLSIRSDETPYVDPPSLVGETLSVGRSCLSVPNFDMLHLDDPAPFLRGIGNVVGV